MNKIFRDLLTVGIVGTVAIIGLKECSYLESENTKDYFSRSGNFRGYKTVISQDGLGRQIYLEPKVKREFVSYLHGLDEDCDGRFDTITLIGLPKGHALEKYANSDSLKVAYEEVKNQK